jgi:hypothetical protein
VESWNRGIVESWNRGIVKSLLYIPWSTIIFGLLGANAASWPRFALSVLVQRSINSRANPRKNIAALRQRPPGVGLVGPLPRQNQQARSTLSKVHAFLCRTHLTCGETFFPFQSQRRSHSFGFVPAQHSLFARHWLVFPVAPGIFETKILSFFPVCRSTWPSRHNSPVGNRVASQRTIDPTTVITSSQP